MKNILIVGCSSGIGKALKEKLEPHNNIFGTYYKNEIEHNENIKYLNVLDENIDLSFLPNTLDGLAYCPGTINLKPFTRIKEEDFINDYKIQVIGAIKVIQKSIDKLKNSNNASIVLFSSVAAQLGLNFHSVVSCNKGAIEGLTKALSAEFAPSIRVNCIAPSITQTPLAAQLLNTIEKIEANALKHPLKKIGTANDIANIASFLLSNESSWITGQIFHVDGGISTIKL